MADNVLEKLVVEIRTDQSNLKKDFNRLKGKMAKEGDRQGRSFGKGFSVGFAKIGGVLGIILAIRKSWDFSKVAKNFARDAEEIQSKHDTVFKGMEERANQWAEEFGSSIGRATSEIRKFTSGLADVLKPLGMTTDEAFETSKQMTQLALDVASFNNRQDADVIRAFTSALTGERESLKTLGIVISEADVKQEAYQSGLVKVGAELTKTAKAQATVNLLFKNSKDAQGDLIRTSGSLANIEKKRQAQTQNFMEQIGKETMPVFRALNEYLSELFVSMKNNEGVMDAFGVTIKSIGTSLIIVVGAAKGVIDGLASLYKMAKAIINNNYADFLSAQMGLTNSWETTFEAAIKSISNMWESSPLGSVSQNKTSIQQAIEDVTVLKQRLRGSEGYSSGGNVSNYQNDLAFRSMINKRRTRGSAGYDSDTELSYFATQQVKEAMPVMEEYNSLWQDIGQAQQVAMGNLISNWASAIKLFEKANSMLQQFLNMLAQVAMQQIAMAAVKFAGNLISSGGSSAADVVTSTVSGSLDKRASSANVTNALLIENNQLQKQILNKKQESTIQGSNIVTSYDKSNKRKLRYT